MLALNMVEAWPVATLQGVEKSCGRANKLQVLRLRASHSAQDDNRYYKCELM